MAFSIHRLVCPSQGGQPDIVVNGAGQDNHFTDPLANMEVTARLCPPYRLLPQILWCWKGYSVEGHYVCEPRILLALAGLDYSQVVEPDLERVKPRQAQRVTDHIAWLVDELSQMWAGRKGVDLEAHFGKGKFFERKRMVYYDTAGITETQNGKIRLCSSCAGWELVESRSDRYAYATVAVMLPWNACPGCRGEAEAAYQEQISEKKAKKVVFCDPERDKVLGCTN